MEQQLIVEGNDGIVLSQLLMRRGLPPPIGYSNEIKFKKEFVKNAGSIEKAIVAFEEGLRNSSILRLGIIVDADNVGFQQRRNSFIQIIRNRIPDFDANLFQPDTGNIFHFENDFKVGIWIMPDNDGDGYLEHFLERLIPENNHDLRDHAFTATDDIPNDINVIPQVRIQKAKLHTYLAWQAQPGLPFGTALAANYFDHTNQYANAFVEWFQGVFELG